MILFSRAAALLLTLFASSGPAAELSVSDIVSAHRTAIDGIHSLDLQVKARSLPAGVDYDYHWTWSGERQRCQHRFLNRKPIRSSVAGIEYPVGTTDATNGPSGYRALLNYSHEDPVDLTEAVDHPASGQIDDRRSGHSLVVDVQSEIGLIIPGKAGEAVSLWELVENARSTELIKSPGDSDADGCYVLEIRVDGAEHSIWLSPQHNFMLKKHRVAATPESAAWSRSVVDFTPLGGGGFLATKLKTIIESKNPLEISTFVEILSANEPIPDEAFEVRFPKGLIVFDNTTGNRIIWGDGKPDKVFESKDAFSAWTKAARQAYFARNPLNRDD